MDGTKVNWLSNSQSIRASKTMLKYTSCDVTVKEHMLSKRILVTGGAGFIGSHIVEALEDRGEQVLVVDDLSSGRRENLSTSTNILELTIGDEDFRREAIKFQPDVIIHCAAQSSVSVSMRCPVKDAETNIVGGVNVATVAIESGCKQFVYINTGGALYGEPEYLPCDEIHPIKPLSAYGLSKWTLESYLKLLISDSIPLKTLRLANVYGPRQDPHGEAGVIAIFGLQMLQGEEVVVFGDGEQTRDFVYVTDVAEAVLLAMESKESITANIGSEVALSVNDLFALMSTYTDYGKKPRFQGVRLGDVKHIVLDNKFSKKSLGWQTTTSIEDGLKQTLEWLQWSLR